MQQGSRETSCGSCSISAAAIRPRPSCGADAKSRLLPGERELAESPWTYLGDTKGYETLLFKTWAQKHLWPNHYSRPTPQDAVENRSRAMAEAVHPRILPLSTLGLEPEDVDSDVDVVDVDQADLCVAFATATVAPASGYEVEFFTGQL